MPRVVIPRSVRSTVSRYVFEKTFGRVRDVRVREKQASFLSANAGGVLSPAGVLKLKP